MCFFPVHPSARVPPLFFLQSPISLGSLSAVLPVLLSSSLSSFSDCLAITARIVPESVRSHAEQTSVYCDTSRLQLLLAAILNKLFPAWQSGLSSVGPGPAPYAVPGCQAHGLIFQAHGPIFQAHGLISKAVLLPAAHPSPTPASHRN